MGFPKQQHEVPGVQSVMAPTSMKTRTQPTWPASLRTQVAEGSPAAVGPGSWVIGSSSVNSDSPSPTLAPYAATNVAIANFSASLAQLLGKKGIRVNSVAPGPIWTPLIPATMPNEKVANFGDDTPLGRAGQPAELASVYVLPSDEGSYISGARIAALVREDPAHYQPCFFDVPEELLAVWPSTDRARGRSMSR